MLCNGTEETLKGGKKELHCARKLMQHGITSSDTHVLCSGGTGTGQEEVHEEQPTVALHSSNCYHKFTVSSPTHSAVVSSAETFGGRQEELPIAANTQLVDLVTCVVEPPGGRWLGRGGGSFQT